MAGKKKGSKGSKAAAAAAAAEAIPQEVEEEFVAIEAIFDSFALHEDHLGFTLDIVPELGNPEDNFVSAELLFRCVFWGLGAAAVVVPRCARARSRRRLFLPPSAPEKKKTPPLSQDGATWHSLPCTRRRPSSFL